MLAQATWLGCIVVLLCHYVCCSAAEHDLLKRATFVEQLVVPTTIASSSRPGHRSCSDLLLAASSLPCRRAATGPEVRVWQCSEAGAADGYLLLAFHSVLHQRELSPPSLNSTAQKQPAAEHGHADLGRHNIHGHHVFRIRMVGKEVLVPPITYCGKIAVAETSSISFPGSYHVEVLLLYSNFTYWNPGPVRQHIHAASFNLTFLNPASQPGDAAASAVDTQATKSVATSDNTCIAAECPVCNTHSMPGRWLVKDELAKPQLRQTCVTYNAWGGCDHRNSTISVKESSNMVEWQPYGCTYEPFTAMSLGMCTQQLKKPVCIMGDSHMRHLHNMMVKILSSFNNGSGNNDSAMQQATQPINGKTIKTVTPSELVHLRDNVWGTPTDTANCSYVFWNVGQWPLAYTAGTESDPTVAMSPERPWSVRRYVTHVEALARHMIAQQKQHDNKQFWVTTNSHPLVRRHQDPADDFRTSPLFLMYNKVAANVMDSHGIEVVDTFSVADPLSDFSYDGAHYLGIIGKTQAELVLNVICKK